MLSEQPQLLDKVFGEPELTSQGLGRPDVIILPTDGSGHSGPPLLQIEIRALDSKVAPVKISAMVDTGASATCIPLKLVESLGLSPVGTVRIATPSGDHMAEIFGVEMGIERLGSFTAQVLGVNLDMALLGSDILSKFSVLIHADGGMSFYRK